MSKTLLDIMATLTQEQRGLRIMIRNLFLIADIEELESAKANYDEFGRSVLQEMIDTCKMYGVTNHGDAPWPH